VVQQGTHYICANTC
jgi:hypothetical protein